MRKDLVSCLIKDNKNSNQRSNLYNLELDIIPCDAKLIDMVFANKLGEKIVYLWT